MKALILGLGIPAAIVLAIVVVIGAGKMMLEVSCAIARYIRHEMMMHPKERYYRVGGIL